MPSILHIMSHFGQDGVPIDSSSIDSPEHFLHVNMKLLRTTPVRPPEVISRSIVKSASPAATRVDLYGGIPSMVDDGRAAIKNGKEI